MNMIHRCFTSDVAVKYRMQAHRRIGRLFLESHSHRYCCPAKSSCAVSIHCPSLGTPGHKHGQQNWTNLQLICSRELALKPPCESCAHENSAILCLSFGLPWRTETWLACSSCTCFIVCELHHSPGINRAIRICRLINSHTFKLNTAVARVATPSSPDRYMGRLLLCVSPRMASASTMLCGTCRLKFWVLPQLASTLHMLTLAAHSTYSYTLHFIITCWPCCDSEGREAVAWALAKDSIGTVWPHLHLSSAREPCCAAGVRHFRHPQAQEGVGVEEGAVGDRLRRRHTAWPHLHVCNPPLPG